MATRMRPRPTPEQLRAAYVEQIVAPALGEVSGRDGRTSTNEASKIRHLDAKLALAGAGVDAYFDQTGYKSSSTLRVASGVERGVLGAMLEARGPDGAVDPARLPPHLQAVYRALGGAEGPGPVEPGPGMERLRHSANVLAKVLRAYGLEDGDALLAEASARHDGDGNGYLKRSELEAAAKVLTGAGEDLVVRDLGIVSDLDKTIIPPGGAPLPAAAYPGIAQLLVELEAVDGDAGDLTFVTARTPDRVVDVPDWLDAHGVPAGPIEPGRGGIPWVALAEKIRDITRVFEAHPDKGFVLFGDSSHRDPEVYRAIREAFGERVKAAFIHRVTDDVPADRVEGLHLIDNYAEAAAHLHDLGVLSTDAARRVMDAAQLQGLDITDAEIDGLLGVR